MICEHCGENKPASAFNPESFSPTTCFRCRVSGVSFANPIKSGQGEDQWRHSTIRESVRQQVSEARANGLDPVPKHTAGGYTPSKSQLDKLKASK